jgi:FMN phosphatase YigB (HAD superfamily)
MIRAVTLDFWGTLVDDREGGAKARIQALASVLPGVPLDRATAAYGVSWDRFQRAGADGWGLPPAALLCMALDELETTLRPPVYQAVLSAWETEKLTCPPALLPGVREMLVELRRRGLLVALISDTGATPGSGLRGYLASQGCATCSTGSPFLTRPASPSVRCRHLAARWQPLACPRGRPCT